jgi:hypothetical protein
MIDMMRSYNYPDRVIVERDQDCSTSLSISAKLKSPTSSLSENFRLTRWECKIVKWSDMKASNMS